jgi:WD40 repeat protein
VYAIAFSPNGCMVLSGSQDKTLKLWNAETGEKIRTFYGHTHAVTSVTFSPGGSMVLSGSLDNTIRLWNVTTGKEIVRMFSFDNDEWISMTPEGYYTASKNAEQFIRFRIDNEIHGIEKYRYIYHQPDIVRKALCQRNKTGNDFSTKLVTPNQIITNEKDGTQLVLIPEGEFLAGKSAKN